MRSRNQSVRAIVDRTRNTLIGNNIEIADNFLFRLVGLLGRKGLESGGGMLIQPSSGVHTFGMCFSIDVVTLDKNLRVLSVHPAVHPWRTSGLGWRTRAVLELPAGSTEHCPILPGDQLEILQPADGAHSATSADLDSPALRHVVK